MICTYLFQYEHLWVWKQLLRNYDTRLWKLVKERLHHFVGETDVTALFFRPTMSSCVMPFNVALLVNYARISLSLIWHRPYWLLSCSSACCSLSWGVFRPSTRTTLRLTVRDKGNVALSLYLTLHRKYPLCLQRFPPPAQILTIFEALEPQCEKSSE